MSKTTTPVAVATSHKLAPTVTSKAKAKTVAAQDGRKRPIVAINEEGKLVVCCRRTAKKNGWDIQEVLYERAKAVKVEAPVVPAPKRERRAVDVAKTAKVKEAKKVVDAALDDILGK
jgi:nucleotidyltransferase/DNA polymerase involved in DNA repair